MQPAVHSIDGPNPLQIYYTGPSQDKGPLPAVIYLALSGEDSLTLDPYNLPIQALQGANIRAFSFTLPGHGPGLKNTEAIAHWANLFTDGQNPIATFLSQADANIRYLVDTGWINPQHIACAGLSRGGFMAAMLSIMNDKIGWLVAYAPITDLALIHEFQTVNLAPIAEKYALKHLADQFIGKKIRFYVGNRDERISTDACYHFIRAVVEANYANGKRSAPVELMISPSQGKHGHGTAAHIFKEGMEWLKMNWNIASSSR